MTAVTVAHRVTAGMKLLDVKKPGWREKINWEVFSIRNGNRCILGQLYGDYVLGQAKLFTSNGARDDQSGKAAAHGFIVTEETPTMAEWKARWDALEETWKALAREQTAGT